MERLVVLGIGSNMGRKEIYLKKAIEELTIFFGSNPCESSIYETAPVGFESDASFLNQCVSFHSDYTAAKVLKGVMAIEKKLGRKRNQPKEEGYLSRTIDIDILFLGDEIHKNEDLIVPHPRLHERNFVLVPLSEIAPRFIHPVKQIKVFDLLNQSSDDNCVKKITV